MDNHAVIGRGRYRSPLDQKNPLPEYDSTPLIRFLRSASPTSSDTFAPPSSVDSAKYRPALFSGSSGSSGGFGSPLSMLDSNQMRSPSMYRTPVKAEEEVLVMDGILVGPASSGKTPRSSNSGRAFLAINGPSPSPGDSAYKAEICCTEEESGSCRFSPSCPIAHGKQEVFPTRFPAKKKSEVSLCKSFTSTGSCTYGSKCRFVHQIMAVAAAEAALPPTIRTAFSTKFEGSSKTPGITTSESREWSPLDDGIEVVLPYSSDKAPSRHDIDAYMREALYGSSNRRRLPVFSDICSERSDIIY